MEDDTRPGGGDRDDYRYYGPFGAPREPNQAAEESDSERTAPLGIGQWSYGEDTTVAARSPERTQILPPQPGPTYAAAPTQAGPLFPAPVGVIPLRPRPPEEVATTFPPRQRQPLRAAAIIALAALTALVIGTAAGYGGSRLAQRNVLPPAVNPSPGASSAAAPTPSPNGTSETPLPPATGQSNTVEVAKRAVPSTVMIQVGSGTSATTGSGFILDADGRIMTNNHVVAAAADGGRVGVVFSDGTKTTASVVGRSPSYDLAVIKVARSSHVRPIRIGDSDASQVGEPVIAVGSPLGLPGTVTAGIVSAKHRPVVVNGSENADAPSAYIDAIQTDAPINPGNSGGPLVDAAARVIGVDSAILTLGSTQGESGSIGLGFAIPINQAMQIGDLLVKKGKATYPVIGANVALSDTGDGIELTNVEPGGPAAAAGLRQGDVINSIDKLTVTRVEELIVNIRTHRPGDKVQLGYQRDGASNEAQVTLGSKEG
jgi:putative serine protease PepD